MNPDYIGSLLLLPYDFVPAGFAACEGQLYPKRYESLFKLLGTQFGGSGAEEFALPDLRNAAPIGGVSYVIVTNGEAPQ
jgi:microcystin-dependent protein